MKTDHTISASEIGQYNYCSVAWYLQRCGYEPESRYLEQGTKAHVALGKTLEKVQWETKMVSRYTIIGVLFLVVFLLFVMGVILL